jgi:hypothetical protein
LWRKPSRRGNNPGITDHDTFKGYDQAVPWLAKPASNWFAASSFPPSCTAIPSTCWGIFSAANLDDFRTWVIDQQTARRDRNVRLVARLQELGFDITLAEAEARGRGMTGRPHFAQIMVEKGTSPTCGRPSTIIWTNPPKATFIAANRISPREWRGSAPPAASPRLPIRARQGRHTGADARALRFRPQRDRGISQRSHSPGHHLYLGLASHYGLKVTGGSDYHGTVKPNVTQAPAITATCIPATLLDQLRA